MVGHLLRSQILGLVLSLTVIEINVQRKSALATKALTRKEQVGRSTRTCRTTPRIDEGCLQLVGHRDAVRKDLSIENALQVTSCVCVGTCAMCERRACRRR